MLSDVRQSGSVSNRVRAFCPGTPSDWPRRGRSGLEIRGSGASGGRAAVPRLESRTTDPTRPFAHHSRRLDIVLLQQRKQVVLGF